MNSTLEDYEVLKVVGCGSFGTCYKVRSISTGDVLVWKAVDYSKMSEEKKKLLCNEVNLLSEINHPFIVKYYSRILHKETFTLYIMMEWCQGGDLSSVIKETNKIGNQIEEWYIWRVIYQLARALEHLHHDFSLVHRDVKAANVFLDCKGNIKLGDFGLSCFVDMAISAPKTLTVGTLHYLSPETLNGAKYSFKSDIWSFGCLVYELCALAPPFDGISMTEIFSNIKGGRFQRIPAHYSDSLSKIISSLLTVLVEVRPSAKVIAHHPAVIANQTNGSANFPMCRTVSNKSDSCNKKNLTNQLGAITINNDDPEDVTRKIFRDKWLAKLESVRSWEAKLRDKAEQLEKRQHSLEKREKKLALLERQAKDKMARAQVYLNRCKESKQLALKDRTNVADTSFSADPGDTSIPRTIARLDPLTLPKPNFGNFKKNKHVHFVRQAHNNKKDSTELSYFQVCNLGREEENQTTIKGVHYRSCQVIKSGKENEPASGTIKRNSMSRLSVRSSNIFI